MSRTLNRSSLFVVAALALHCGEPAAPVSTAPSPGVTVLTPVPNQTFPAGQAIEVRFAVRGTDASGPRPVTFALGEGTTRTPGVGKVVAYLDASGPVAEARALPSDASPFIVPDGTLGNAAALVTPGRHRIRLELRYNDGTVVTPQDLGEVSVMVQ
ncbi:MAG: hypothetical protein U0324_14230 [Polyangiales bacterium]